MNAICNFQEPVRKNATAVAKFADAAQFPRQGRTAHYTPRIPILSNEDSTCYNDLSSVEELKLSQACFVIQVDVLMCMQNNFEPVDRILKDLMRICMSFRGKAILFLGDFRKTLPVDPRCFRARVLASCFRKSSLFPLLIVLRLTTNMSLLALQQDAGADEEAIRFPKLLLGVENESLPQSKDDQIEFLSSVN